MKAIGNIKSNIIFNKIKLNFQELIRRLCKQQKEIRLIQSEKENYAIEEPQIIKKVLNKWQKPLYGWIKITFDVVIENKNFSLTVISRDRFGNVLRIQCKSLNITDPQLEL